MQKQLDNTNYLPIYLYTVFIFIRGCWSYVGKVMTNQALSLGQPGCLWVCINI